VLYRLLREQGDPAEFLIGMPLDRRSKDAHAWVEVDRVDVGPPPGGRGRLPLARYPLDPLPGLSARSGHALDVGKLRR
jgi:hypothetical protein